MSDHELDESALLEESGADETFEENSFIFIFFLKHFWRKGRIIELFSGDTVSVAHFSDAK